ncbi:purine-nucleoside phosphorylase [Sediminicola luteus]|uniref:Uridine phosphorylase n=1 Tax=Sediminicola luteus TaxID=319238 RepID=A0A2A4G6J7_9FLAO|nr:purine-nucleoside phosphorylase [Sediminicola luteus]PCE64061.1 purine-nucleoside phosphorylase [Sediminicola luteus]
MSVHIDAKPGEVAETILLPGDPLRAQWIAETYLEDTICYNQVRGMLGFTGTYKGKRISVQGTGMGIPSCMIYTHELITEYGVKNLIRVGSAGAYQADLKLHDIVLALSASTTSGINQERFKGYTYAPTAHFELVTRAIEQAKKMAIDIKGGNVLSADTFYEDRFESYEQWAKFGVLCVEMETAGLYTLAAKHGVKALSILTISDSLVTGERTTAAEREKGFGTMAQLALEMV